MKKNNQRTRHSLQAGGKDNDCDDLRWFSTGSFVVVKEAKNVRPSTAITVS